MVQTIKNLPAIQETWVQSLDQEDPLDKGMATHSSILSENAMAEDLCGLQSLGLQRVGHDWAANTLTFHLLSVHAYACYCILNCLKVADRRSVTSPFICVFLKKSESEVAQSCPVLCDPMDCSLPGSSVHGIFQARVLEWAAISFSRGSSQPRDRTWVSCMANRCFTTLSHQGSLLPSLK